MTISLATWLTYGELSCHNEYIRKVVTPPDSLSKHIAATVSDERKFLKQLCSLKTCSNSKQSKLGLPFIFINK